jgi:putative membrane protein
MSKRLSSREAKDEVKKAIQEVEGQTSAEIVVAVRPKVAHYRHVDYLIGFVFALAVLVVLLFAETEFETVTMPAEVLGAFLLGAVFSAHVPPLRRLFASSRLVDRRVYEAACAAFVDLGVMKTTGRTGILVFVAAYDKRVEVVTDVGVDRNVLGAGFTEALAALAKAGRKGPDLDALLEALRSLGPVLGKALPRAADDVNELPDEVA